MNTLDSSRCIGDDKTADRFSSRTFLWTKSWLHAISSCSRSINILPSWFRLTCLLVKPPWDLTTFKETRTRVMNISKSMHFVAVGHQRKRPYLSNWYGLKHHMPLLMLHKLLENRSGRGGYQKEQTRCDLIQNHACMQRALIRVRVLPKMFASQENLLWNDKHMLRLTWGWEIQDVFRPGEGSIHKAKDEGPSEGTLRVKERRENIYPKRWLRIFARYSHLHTVVRLPYMSRDDLCIQVSR